MSAAASAAKVMFHSTGITDDLHLAREEYSWQWYVIDKIKKESRDHNRKMFYSIYNRKCKRQNVLKCELEKTLVKPLKNH